MKSIDIWRNRYVAEPGLGSGVGSKGSLLDFKVDFLNDFIKQNDVRTVLDFGHGDLAVASRLIVDSYTGIDIFDGEKFNTKDLKIKECKFDVYDGENVDLVICLDVLYHLLKDEQEYMRRSIDKMIEKSNKYIIIYALDSSIDIEHRERMFDSKWMQHIEKNNDVKLVFQQPEYMPGSSAKFFIFEKSRLT